VFLQVCADTPALALEPKEVSAVRWVSLSYLASLSVDSMELDINAVPTPSASMILSPSSIATPLQRNSMVSFTDANERPQVATAPIVTRVRVHVDESQADYAVHHNPAKRERL
jgi:hypothetical protein